VYSPKSSSLFFPPKYSQPERQRRGPGFHGYCSTGTSLENRKYPVHKRIICHVQPAVEHVPQLVLGYPGRVLVRVVLLELVVDDEDALEFGVSEVEFLHKLLYQIRVFLLEAGLLHGVHGGVQVHPERHVYVSLLPISKPSQTSLIDNLIVRR
jgi:hypothetical protein